MKKRLIKIYLRAIVVFIAVLLISVLLYMTVYGLFGVGAFAMLAAAIALNCFATGIYLLTMWNKNKKDGSEEQKTGLTSIVFVTCGVSMILFSIISVCIIFS